MDHQKQAQDFLKKTGVIFSAVFVKHGKHFADDKDTRDIYAVTLKRGSRDMTVMFGQSLSDSCYKIVNKSGKVLREISRAELEKAGIEANNLSESWLRMKISNLCFVLSPSEKIIRPKAPTAYDVLACLTKYDPGTFANFCADMGMDTDSRRAEKTYRAVVDEWRDVKTIWTDLEIQELAEIQ